MTVAFRRHTSANVAVLLRLVTFGGLALLALLIDEGLALQRIAFVVLLASALARGLLSDRIPLFAAFELGVALVVLGDDLGGGLILPRIDPYVIEDARRFAVLAASSVVVGYELITLQSLQGPRRRSTMMGEPADIGPRGASRSRALWVLVGLTFYVSWRYLPGAVRSATEGRLGQAQPDVLDQSALGAITSPFSRSISMVLPALWVWWFGPTNRRRAFLISLPILGLLLVGGTRYYLLVGFTGLMLSFRSGKREIRGAICISVVVLVLAGWVITATRAEGLTSTFSVSQVGSSDTRLLGGEGVLRTTSQIVDYTSREGTTNGTSLGSVALFWVPRALWPGKPTLLGYWFPRQYGAQGLSSGHSVSAGFAGDVLIDFGMGLGAVFLLVLGMAFRKVDGGLRRSDSGDGVLAVASGALYGLAFFAGRSLATATISTVGVLAVTWMVLRISGPRRSRLRGHAGGRTNAALGAHETRPGLVP